MRIPTGVTDQVIYFVAVNSSDYVTRETGLTTFTVYRSRNGGTATAYTTPTVTELSAANMPGVYKLLLDEDMTIDSGDQSQEICLHITQASMAPVTRVFELYRPSVTDGERITVSSGAVSTVTTTTTATNVTTVNGLASGVITATSIATDAIGAAELAADAVTEIANAVWDMDATGHQTQGTFGQAIGDPVADTNTLFKAVVTDATGATVGVDVVAVQADTDNIQTRIPTSLVSGRIDASVGAIAADAITAAATASDFGTEIGTAVWATTTRQLTALDEDVTTLDLDAHIRTAVGLASANLDTQIGDLPTNAELATSQAAADDATLAAIAALNNITVDSIWDEGIEGSYSARQLMRLYAAALGGKASGLNTTTAVYQNTDDDVPVITATVDEFGNRTAVTLDLTDTP